MDWHTRARSATRRIAQLAVLLLAGCAAAPPQPVPVARDDQAAVARQVQALITQQMQAHEVTGLSIAIVDDQRVQWSSGSGWADKAAGVPATDRTLYRMGSISKLLTATAALQLAQQGRLQLDAPIQAALPGFAIRTRYGDAPITPRQLMTHHAGLPRDLAAGMWGNPVGDFRTMVAQQADADAAYPPGLLMAYSNVGVTVLGAAVERLAGVPFEDHLQRAVLGPLGMAGASFSAGVPASPAMARAYRGNEPADEPALRDVPAGGLNASVLDLSRFLMMVFADGRSGDQAVLAPDLLAEMLRVQNDDVPLDVGFRVGLGWMLSTLGADTLRNAGPVAHHAGATMHFRSQMYALPQHKLGVIVAANSSTAGTVVDTVAKRALALALEAKTGIRQPDPPPGFRPARQPWPEAALLALVGDYATVAGYVRVTRQGDQLSARLGERELQLVPGEDGRLGLRFKLMGLLTLPLGDLDRLELQVRRIAGRDVLVARLADQEMLMGERLPPASEAPHPEMAGTWAPQLAPGEYRVLQDARVTEDGGRLLVETRLANEPQTSLTRTPLRLLSDHEAVALGPLADSGEVVRWRTSDGQVRAQFAGYTFSRQGR